MIIGWASFQGYHHTSTIDVQEFLHSALCGVFASIRWLSFCGFELRSVDGSSLKRSREAGIFDLCFDRQARFATDDLFDFFFGPTRKEFQVMDRCIYDIIFFDKSIFQRFLEVRLLENH